MEMYFCKFCNKEHDNWYVRPDSCRRECRISRALCTSKYRENNKHSIKEYKAKWQKENAEYLSTYQDKWRATGKKWEEYKPIKNKKASIRNKERYSTDIQYRMASKLRRRVWEAIKNDPGSTISKSLGCSISQLLTYIESKFYNNPTTGEAMTWSNYGQWHIDHIRALCTFDLKDSEQYKLACHYTNLQPLWVEDHIKKTKKDLHDAF